MVKEGRTKLECMRFSFLGNATDDDADPTCIDKDSLSTPHLEEHLAGRLSIHAKKLEMAQRIQKSLIGYHESLSTLLFEHVLGYLAKELGGPRSQSVCRADWCTMRLLYIAYGTLRGILWIDIVGVTCHAIGSGGQDL
jgi:hypothetical protein